MNMLAKVIINTVQMITEMVWLYVWYCITSGLNFNFVSVPFFVFSNWGTTIKGS